MTPQIISSYDGGKHNADLSQTISRLGQEVAYKDLSCIQIMPGFGQIPTKCVAAWMNMPTPPNGKFVRMWPVAMEVGAAFSETISAILAHPDLSKWKYVLTLEHDNIPPNDGIVRILKQMDAHPEFAAIGGLYFTQGYGGVAQIWGDPTDPVLNFRPQVPKPDTLQECCGTGMGLPASGWTCSRMSGCGNLGSRRWTARTAQASALKTCIFGVMRANTDTAAPSIRQFASATMT